MTNDNTKLPPLTPAEIAELRRLQTAAEGPLWDYVANAKYLYALRNAATRLLAAAEREGRLRAAASAYRNIEDARDHDEQFDAAMGMRYSIGHLNAARQALEAALAETQEVTK